MPNATQKARGVFYFYYSNITMSKPLPAKKAKAVRIRFSRRVSCQIIANRLIDAYAYF